MIIKRTKKLDLFEKRMQKEIGELGLAITALYRPGNQIIVPSLVPGETIPRKFPKAYLIKVEELREGHVDLRDLETLQGLIVRRSFDHEQATETMPVTLLLAYEHLVNAGNDELDRMVREQHFDCAGARVSGYATLSTSMSANIFMKRYMALFREAGGL